MCKISSKLEFFCLFHESWPLWGPSKNRTIVLTVKPHFRTIFHFYQRISCHEIVLALNLILNKYLVFRAVPKWGWPSHFDPGNLMGFVIGRVIQLEIQIPIWTLFQSPTPKAICVWTKVEKKTCRIIADEAEERNVYLQRGVAYWGPLVGVPNISASTSQRGLYWDLGGLARIKVRFFWSETGFYFPVSINIQDGLVECCLLFYYDFIQCFEQILIILFIVTLMIVKKKVVTVSFNLNNSGNYINFK